MHVLRCGEGRITAAGQSRGASDCICRASYTLEAESCVLCGVDTYKPDKGDHACTRCPAHSSNALTTQRDSEVDCLCSPGASRGAWVGLVEPGAVCAACAPGKAKPTLAEAPCSDCVPGKFSPTSGSSACVDCPPGKYSRVLAATSCLWCATGSASPDPGVTACSTCREGSYSAKEGGTGCELCAAGTYAQVKGSVTCPVCRCYTRALLTSKELC